MPQKDPIHDKVRRALEHGGWEIVSEHFTVKKDKLPAFIDLTAIPGHAEYVPIHNGPIAVEVNSFNGFSFMTDLYEALGQYLLYLDKLEALNHPHILFVATPARYHDYFQRPSVQRLIQRYQVRLLMVNTVSEEIESWTK